MKSIDLTGQRFGRLTVIDHAPRLSVKIRWRCLCDCGKESIAQVSDLRSGKQRSCGCLHLERITVHGFSSADPRKTKPTYRTWLGMIQRCTNPNAAHYHRYGGRGIAVCDRWREFKNFLADMGERPKGRTLERVDNDRGYEPANCRWATRKEQAMNRTWTPPRTPRERNAIGQFEKKPRV